MDPSQIALARTILGWAASFGAGHIVTSIATTQTPITTTFHRITVPVGKFALGSLVGAHAKKHTEEQFDQAVETVKSLHKGYKEKQQNK